jgi:4-amino-4-deoxy-L-arabinose transferase-like glycosyltransferase
LALAVLVGFALRLAWAIWATGPVGNPLTDNAQYLDAATRFSNLETPQLFGEHTAFQPPGYPLFLAPFAFLSRHTPLSLEFGASLLNVVAGTVTIWATGRLASAWIGGRAQNPAAWLLALAPGQIYYTSAALSETVFSTLTALLLLLATRFIRDRPAPTARVLFAFGLAVGFVMLVRTPGGVLVLAPALVLRASNASWRGAVRATGWGLLGIVVLVLPWTIRNAVQVGVAVPVSTNNAAFLCTGHSDYSTGTYDSTPEGLRYCFGGSAYDEGNNEEPEWYRRTTARAVRWAVTHPVDEVRLTLWKTYETMRDDADAFDAAEDFGSRTLVSDRVAGVFRMFANGWHWAVLALSILGLCCLRVCRRALPIWAVSLAYFLSVFGGVGQTRYNHGIMPLLVIFAGAVIGTMIATGDTALTAEGSPADAA